MNNLAIIPARGGSKRIPRKNIKNFLGKPIISYSILTAIKSGLFNEIMVSTDDEEIAKIALEYGAKVPFFRSEINSNDFATTFDVIEEVLVNYNGLNRNFENVCCIYPCAPLCKSEDLIHAFQILTSKQYDSVFPLTEYSNPIQRSFVIKDEDKADMLFPQFINSRSQDIDRSYFDPGQFYWLNTSKILECGKIYTLNSGAIILDELNVQDIDNINDWEMAEFKYKLLKK